MKLTLTDDDGIVLEVWTIGDKREYDIEDLDAEPEHDFYTEDMFNFHSGNYRHIGESIQLAIMAAITEEGGECDE